MQSSRRTPLALRRPALVFWLVAAVIFIADQVTKSFVRVLWASPSTVIPLDRVVAYWVKAKYAPSESLDVIGQALKLTYVRNEGAAFGLFPGYQPFFIATSIIVLIVVAAYWHRSRPVSAPVVIALALVTSGSVGNLIDRAILGRVTDFVYLAIIDFPVFNVADSAIVVGVIILIAWLLFSPEPEQAAEQAAECEPEQAPELEVESDPEEPSGD